MDVISSATSAFVPTNRRPQMTTAKATTTTRTCIGSKRFGIEAHEAPLDDFPAQPSQSDGFGRMCRPHWREYTAGLRRDAQTRKAEQPDTSADGTS
jgi:hypothetical protein